jgi:hypothetical protein
MISERQKNCDARRKKDRESVAERQKKKKPMKENNCYGVGLD